MAIVHAAFMCMTMLVLMEEGKLLLELGWSSIIGMNR